jgi:DNA-binding NtrC family response regulator
MAVPHEGAWEVLVVDDDPDIRDLLAEFFRSRDLVCATASDGRAATKALEQSDGRYGLVLTDIAMPGADGFAVLAAARISNAHAYVVIVTGYAALETAIQAVRAGAQDYLTKPFALSQLDVVVTRAAGWMRTHLELARSGARADETLAALSARLGSMEARLESIESSLARMVAAVADPRRTG